MLKKRGMAVCIVILYSVFSAGILAAEVPVIQGNVEDGKIKAVLCASCHGEKGKGKAKSAGQPAVPRLAGQIPDYFIKSMYDYKTDKRADPLMNAISKGLTDVDIANLAVYYESLK